MNSREDDLKLLKIVNRLHEIATERVDLLKRLSVFGFGPSSIGILLNAYEAVKQSAENCDIADRKILLNSANKIRKIYEGASNAKTAKCKARSVRQESGQG